MKNILVCLGDNAPCWITRTIWALLNDQQSFMPFTVKVLCTASSAIHLKDRLFHPLHGKFISLVQEYSLHNRVCFTQDDIIIFRKGNRQVKSMQAMDALKIAADCLLKEMEQLCSSTDYRLYACINSSDCALSLYLSRALSEFGRQGDKLVHTRVEGPLINHSDFYYPSLVPRKYNITSSSRQSAATTTCSQWKVYNAEMPLNLENPSEPSEKQPPRKKPAPARQSHSFSPRDLKAYLNSILIHNYDKIHFFPQLNILQDKYRKACFSPIESAIYHHFLVHKIGCSLPVRCEDCFDKACFFSPAGLKGVFIIGELGKKLGFSSARVLNLEKRLHSPTDMTPWFLQHRSRINKKLLNNDFPATLTLTSAGFYGASVYGIEHSKEHLSIAEL